MNEQIWIKITEFPNYEVSSLGEVRNALTGRILSANDNGKGYLSVQLGRRNRRYIHRLVAEAFLKARLPFEINHKNFIKQDNRLDNLEITTRKQNQRHMIIGGKHNKAKLTYSSIQDIYKLLAEGYSQSIIANTLKVSKSTISALVNGNTWSWLNEKI